MRWRGAVNKEKKYTGAISLVVQWSMLPVQGGKGYIPGQETEVLHTVLCGQIHIHTYIYINTHIYLHMYKYKKVRVVEIKVCRVGVAMLDEYVGSEEKIENSGRNCDIDKMP